jgi:hypothetical protein
LDRDAALERTPAGGGDADEIGAAVARVGVAAHPAGGLEAVEDADKGVGIDGAAFAKRGLALAVALVEQSESAELRRGQTEGFQPAAELAEGVLVGLIDEKSEGVLDVVRRAARGTTVSACSHSPYDTYTYELSQGWVNPGAAGGRRPRVYCAFLACFAPGENGIMTVKDA